MNKSLLFDSFGWGILLWLIGYILGIILFMIVPVSILGLIITPIGILITLYVLLKRIKSTKFGYYIILAFVWVAIGLIGDYFFIVKAFNASDYYKLDVYLYYLLTFVLPLIAGFIKSKNHN